MVSRQHRDTERLVSLYRDIFHGLGIDEATDTITEYIKFCVDCVVTKKVITIYPNNKPYITRELKDCINQKKNGF